MSKKIVTFGLLSTSIGGPPLGQSGAVALPKKYEMLEIWTKFVQKDDFLQ